MTKTVLCFGDSNTFGLKPNPLPWTRQRWGKTERWPSILSDLFDVDVISEGLPGRTATTCNQNYPYLDALPVVPALMESHTPVDVAIVMLGTNDLQASLNLTPEGITISMAAVVRALRRAERVAYVGEPQILVVAPPPVLEIGFRSKTFSGGASKSLALAGLYQEMAQSIGAGFLDAGLHTKVSSIDGIHLDVESHIGLAKAFAAFLGQA